MSRSMRTAHQDAQPRTDDTQTCEECGGELVADGTETVCDECGLVADEDAIDHGPEWRCDDTGERARAGTAVDVTRNDNGFSTRIGFERSRPNDGSHRRLLRAKRLSKHGEKKKDREQGRCLSDIKAIADRLELPQSVSDNACVLFQEFHNASDHTGHTLDAAIAACVYASARIEQVGIGVETVGEQVSVSERQVFLTLDRLREEIDVAIPIASPRMYVGRYVDALGGEPRTVTLAQEVAAEADEAGLTANGAAPSAVATAAVYEAFVAAQWEAKRSQRAVGEVADVSAYTVRRHWQRLQEAGISAGVGDELRSEDDDPVDDEPHAEEAEAVEPTPDNPVTVGSSSKASAYHTTDCEHVSRAPDRRLKHVSQSQLEWHGVDECEACQRIRGEADV